jgi:membrane protease YdiL (CAAX protease family)
VAVATFAIAAVVQLLTLAPGQALILRAVAPKTGMTGGAAFAFLLIAGNVINSLMEECLFRGLMLSHFLPRMRFATANLRRPACSPPGISSGP